MLTLRASCWPWWLRELYKYTQCYISKNYLFGTPRQVWVMAVECLLIYTDSSNPRMQGRESHTGQNEMTLQYGLNQSEVRAEWAHGGLAVFGSLSAQPSSTDLENFWPKPSQANMRRLASSCHKSDWQSQINMAHGNSLNCDNQSVRISCYSGSHMEANTCTVLKVNEFTEAKRLYAKIGLMEWDSRSSHAYSYLLLRTFIYSFLESSS